jgi:peptidoglycan hydrolase CwlO-like protein
VQNKNEALKNLHLTVVTYEARGMATKFEALKASVSKLEKEREESMTKCQEKRTRIEELNSDISKQEVSHACVLRI